MGTKIAGPDSASPCGWALSGPPIHDAGEKSFQARTRCSPPVLSGVDHGPCVLVPRVSHPGQVAASSPVRLSKNGPPRMGRRSARGGGFEPPLPFGPVSETGDLPVSRSPNGVCDAMRADTRLPWRAGARMSVLRHSPAWWVVPESNRARRVKSPLLRLGANDPWDATESNRALMVKSHLLHLGANVPHFLLLGRPSPACAFSRCPSFLESCWWSAVESNHLPEATVLQTARAPGPKSHSAWGARRGADSSL